MSDQELKKVFSKAFLTMRTMKPSELPPVIYQLIALSAKVCMYVYTGDTIYLHTGIHTCTHTHVYYKDLVYIGKRLTFKC